MIRVNRGIIRTFLFPLLMGLSGGAASGAEDRFLIDDFSSENVSALGTRWEGFTDQVMGGISTMTAGFTVQDGARILRMAGRVSLENNGGFIQVRLPLSARGSFDASGYKGVALEVRGTEGSYYVHLRTRGTRMPWQYYDAPVPVSDEWGRVEIPFSSFQQQSTRAELNPEQLSSIAVVGAKDVFDADISIRRIELYR